MIPVPIIAPPAIIVDVRLHTHRAAAHERHAHHDAHAHHAHEPHAHHHEAHHHEGHHRHEARHHHGAHHHEARHHRGEAHEQIHAHDRNEWASIFAAENEARKAKEQKRREAAEAELERNDARVVSPETLAQMRDLARWTQMDVAKMTTSPDPTPPPPVAVATPAPVLRPIGPYGSLAPFTTQSTPIMITVNWPGALQEENSADPKTPNAY